MSAVLRRPKAVVVIPAWRRPELLSICLKYVQEASGADQNFYLFQFDYGFKEENWKVVNEFNFDHSVEWLMRKVGVGNSFNILQGLETGLEWAEQNGCELVHLLEEDLFVGRDYFSCAENIHKDFKPWALSLCRNQHRRIEPIQDPALIYKCQDYQSLGVSFPLDSVREILVHNVSDYFRDMEGYLRMMFPNSRFGGLYPEQDGLCARIIEKNKYDVIYSNIPRSYHAGWYSYHRAGQEPEGTLAEKIAQLESMGEEEMNQRSSYKDIKQIDLAKDWAVKEFYLE